MSEITVNIGLAPQPVFKGLSGSSMLRSRSGDNVSPQIGYIGEIDTSGDRFRLEGNMPFNIKNEGSDPVTLSVRLAGMPAETFVSTVFYQGWNPEIVLEIETGNETDLKYGF